MRLQLDPAKNVLRAFATPIGNIHVPNADEINPVLERIILERMAQASGKVKSNVGGWHSETDLVDWPEIAETDFLETIQTVVSSMVSHVGRSQKFNLRCHLTAWANVNATGAHNAVHNHSGCHWSGVYYVNAGKYTEDDLPRCGDIQFYDPRGPVNMVRHPGKCKDGESFSLMPHSGDLVLFPSWLYHSVNPFLSKTTRISIAFNARVDKFEPLDWDKEDLDFFTY